LRLEPRTRVEVFIPVREDELAYQVISQWVAEEFAFERGGTTVTTTFVGLYASPSTGQVVRDRVQIIFTDVLVESADPSDLNELIEGLHFLRTDIEQMLSDEEEIWITISPIEIIRR
jgi:hypothetical protein